MAKREAFPGYCYNSRKEKVEFHRSIRKDIVLYVRNHGVHPARKKFSIGHEALQVILDEYRQDAGQPDMVIKKLHPKKPGPKPKNQ